MVAGGSQQLLLQLLSGLTRLGESGRHDQHAADAVLGTLADHARDFGCRNRDHREVDVARDFGEAGVQVALDLGVRGAVHRVQVTGETTGAQVFVQVAAGGLTVAGHPDHDDAARVQQCADARGFGSLLPCDPDGFTGVRGLDRERERDDAVVEVVFDAEPGIDEDAHHLAVLRQDVGGELLHPGLTGDGRHVFQQHRPDTAPLEMIRDVEGDLGRCPGGPAEPVVPADPDQFLVALQHQRDPFDVVDIGEPLGVLVGQLLHRCEEAQVDRLRRLLAVKVLQGRDVVGADRPDLRDGAVSQDDVRLPSSRIGRRILAHAAQHVMFTTSGRRPSRTSRSRNSPRIPG